jgi:hypothetical protein
MKKIEINISENKVACKLESGEIVQLTVWNLSPPKHEDLKIQLQTAFSISSNFKEIEKHLQINGFDAHIEDIY